MVTDRYRMRHRTAVYATLAIVAITGCQTFKSVKAKTYETARSIVTSSYDDPNVESKMAEGERLHEAGQFGAARKIFNELAGNTLNPELLSEKARFLEADCYRNERKLPDAADTYHKMLIDHSSGPYRERACQEIFKIADYWLDDTRAEIQAAQEGENVFKRRMTRLFRVDRSKPNMDIEGRALQALEHVHTNDITGPLADKALFWSGYVNFYRGRYEEADQNFSMLIEMHKDSPLRPTATELAIISKNNSTGGAVYDGQKAAEALQMVHHAEASMPEFSSEEKSGFLTRQKLAIRMQQAEKDYKTAEYYEQTRHPGSAYFYYEIVRRRYPGTKYSDLATARMDQIRSRAEADAAAPPSESPFGTMKKQLSRLVGQSVPEEGVTNASGSAPIPKDPGPDNNR